LQSRAPELAERDLGVRFDVLDHQNSQQLQRAFLTQGDRRKGAAGD
jgi:hypothetical protein